MSLNKKSVATLALLFFIFIVAFANEIYVPHSIGKEKIEVEVAQGLGSRKIGELLKNKGVIRSKWAFVTYAFLRGEASLLKPSTYTFFNSPISEITYDLVAGKTREISITILEGWSVADIAAYLEREKIIPAENFKKAGAKHEGYLFPDTYRIYKDSSAEEIVKKMRENFDKKLAPDLRQEISRQKKTIPEIITMASLIEKEVVSDEDRAVVSGILWKRLNAGIALQVDATIVYLKRQATSDKQQENTPKISIADTKIDSPYNTYLNRGLPIGPIANPGISAIKAAIFPKKSPYLYYLSTPDGRTIFSRTLEGHNEAKAKFLR